MGFCNGPVRLANEDDCAYSGHDYLLNPILGKFKMLKFVSKIMISMIGCMRFVDWVEIPGLSDKNGAGRDFME